MLHLAPALRVKDVTIFDLVEQEFYDGEFIFFSRLAAHLSKLAAIPEEDGQEIGVLSELMYLSSKMHVSLQTENESAQGLRTGLQMPVLLGDLLYGRFISALTEAKQDSLLPVYIAYMRQLSAGQVQGNGQQDASYVRLLARKTAEAVALAAGMDDAGQLTAAAEDYWAEQWQRLQREKITTLAALEAVLQAEMC